MSSIDSDISYRLPEGFGPLLELSDASSALGQSVMGRLNTRAGRKDEIVAACLFIKMSNTSRALDSLVRQNLVAEAMVLLRHYVEALLVLKASVEDSGFIDDYLKGDSLYRLKLGNVITRNPEVFQGADLGAVKKSTEELSAEVGQEGIREITMKELARRAGLADFYNAAYGVLSNITHLGARSLEGYLDKGAHGAIEGFNPLPYQELIPLLLVTRVEVALIALGAMDSIFGLSIGEDVKALSTRLHDIAGQFGV